MNSHEVFCKEPDFVCPRCEHVQHLDDYWDYGESSDFVCPNCGAVSEIAEEQVVRFWRWRIVQFDRPQVDVSKGPEEQVEELK